MGQPNSLYDSALAVDNSCYLGPVLGHTAEVRVVPDGQLVPTAADLVPPAGDLFLHDQFAGMITSDFPCVGATTSFRHGTYRLGVYQQLGSIESVAGMGRDLRRFVREQKQFACMRAKLRQNVAFGQYTSFVAIFRAPLPRHEEEFEALMWRHLQLLHDHDDPVWDPARSTTPGDPRFGYCFAGRAFFIVGFNPQASEPPRRFGYCALAFNAEYQISRLQNEGRFVPFARAVRRRYIRLAGHLNPSLPADPEAVQDETRIYSGVPHPDGRDWRCPLHVRSDADPGAEARSA